MNNETEQVELIDSFFKILETITVDGDIRKPIIGLTIEDRDDFDPVIMNSILYMDLPLIATHYMITDFDPNIDIKDLFNGEDTLLNNTIKNLNNIGCYTERQYITSNKCDGDYMLKIWLAKEDEHISSIDIYVKDFGSQYTIMMPKITSQGLQLLIDLEGDVKND